MGGPGSGGWHRWNKRPTIEELCSLDIRLLKRRGMLQPGRSTRLTWSRGEQSAGAVWAVGEGDALVLVYCVRVDSGAWEDRRNRIALTWTEPPYGGQRPWFLCPACTRRVAVLYNGGQGFVCRHCTRRPYGSQGETPQERSIRKVCTMRTRLGVGHNLTQPINAWQKPKGMHWRTFARLVAQEAHAQRAVWHDQHVWSTRMLEEIGEVSAKGGEARGAV